MYPNKEEQELRKKILNHELEALFAEERKLLSSIRKIEFELRILNNIEKLGELDE